MLRSLRPSHRGFTLVEMIGVLAIMAVVAAMVAPSVVRQIKTATAVGEDAKLDDIVQALTNGIRATGIIPNPNLNPTNTSVNGFGWAYLASNYTRLSGSNLTSVFPGLINITVSSGVTNTNETYRRLYLSTNLAAAASKGGFAKTITNWGAVMFPTNAKMYLVSASRPDFSLALATNGFGSGVQTAANNYSKDAVSSLDGWVKQFSDGVISAPANIVGVSRTNQGEFLHVRTIDIAGIFNETQAAQQKAIEQEDKNLEEIARALVAAIQATGQLPNPNVKPFDAGGWANLAQSYTTLTANTANPPANADQRGTLQFAFPRDANGNLTARRVYLDPRLMKYLVAIGGFSTPNKGWDSTTDADASGTADMNEGAMRMYILSSSKPDLGLAAPVNGPNVQTAAESYDDDGLLTALLNWKKVYTPPSDPMPGVIPVPNVIAKWGNPYTPLVNYSTRGEFVNVKVVDLRPLFCRVELIDTACPPTATITTYGSYTYKNPSVNFFSAVAVFDIRDGNLSPIAAARVLTAGPPADITVLGNPQPQYLDRGSTLAAGNPSGRDGTVGTTPAQVTPSLNPQPRFRIPISGSVSPPLGGMFIANVQTFYVLKGTSLQLWDNASVTPVLTTTIESDSSFKYFGSTWTRVD